MYLSHSKSICCICLLVVKSTSAVHLGKRYSKKLYPLQQKYFDKFQSWESATTKPRLKACHRAKKWVPDIVRISYTPPSWLGLRISDKDNAFSYLTEEMSKNVSSSEFFRSCMIQKTDTPLVSNSVAMPSNILLVINEALETSLTNNKDESPVHEGKNHLNMIFVTIVQIIKKNCKNMLLLSMETRGHLNVNHVPITLFWKVTCNII